MEPQTLFNSQLSERDAEDLEQRWAQLLFDLTVRFGKQPDLNALLFLIGLQEHGHGLGNYTKEQKQDLMHIGTCTVFSLSGFYEFSGRDADGWPHFRSVKPIPNLPLKEQERMLRWHIVEYFEQQKNLHAEG